MPVRDLLEGGAEREQARFGTGLTHEATSSDGTLIGATAIGLVTGRLATSKSGVIRGGVGPARVGSGPSLPASTSGPYITACSVGSSDIALIWSDIGIE